jgi:prepilin-type N-terminal cleavage/methylation domain-containing protein
MRRAIRAVAARTGRAILRRTRGGKARMAGRQGFSLIEVIVALFIFSIGVLALAASTGFVGTQLRAADVQAERSAAVQSAIEGLRARDFATVTTRSQANAVTIGRFQVWWDVFNRTPYLKDLRVMSRGPGYLREGGWSNAVVDTVFTSIAR